MKLKFYFKVAGILLAGIGLLFSSSARVEATGKKANYTEPSSITLSSFEVTEGEEGIFIPSRLNKASTKTKKYVNFSPKNTKNLNFLVKSDNTEVVKVKKVSDKKYSYQALKAGVAKLTLTSSAKNKKRKKLTTSILVTVKPKITFSALQTRESSVSLSFSSPVETLNAAEVKLISEAENLVPSSMNLSLDKMSADLIFNQEFKDGKEYRIEALDTEATFVAKGSSEPFSIELITKEALSKEPVPILFKAFNQYQSDITEKLQLSDFTVTVTAKNASFDASNNSITFSDSSENATVKVTYMTKNNKEVTVEGNITPIKSEKEKEDEYHKNFAYYYVPTDNRPVISEVKLEFPNQGGSDEEIITLTMDKDIPDSEKDKYEKKANYEVKIYDKFNKSETTLELSNTKITVEGKNININVNQGSVTEGEIVQGNIKVTVTTKGELRSSTKSFEHDFRKKKSITPNIVSGTSTLNINTQNPKNIILTLNHDVTFNMADSVQFDNMDITARQDNAKQITVTFPRDIIGLHNQNDNNGKYFIIGIVTILEKETNLEFVQGGDAYQIKLTVSSETVTGGSIETTFKVEFIEVENNV